MAKKFEKLKIELTEGNERRLREVYQFVKRDISFGKFINNYIKDKLFWDGIE